MHVIANDEYKKLFENWDVLNYAYELTTGIVTTRNSFQEAYIDLKYFQPSYSFEKTNTRFLKKGNKEQKDSKKTTSFADRIFYGILNPLGGTQINVDSISYMTYLPEEFVSDHMYLIGIYEINEEGKSGVRADFQSFKSNYVSNFEEFINPNFNPPVEFQSSQDDTLIYVDNEVSFLNDCESTNKNGLSFNEFFVE